MNRRGFLKFLGAGAAVAAVAPSQVWPFKKIFLPSLEETCTYNGLIGPIDCSLINMGDIAALELEYFAKEIPVLLMTEGTLYKMFREKNLVGIKVDEPRPPFRIPQLAPRII